MRQNSVSINLDLNEVWEVERVYPLEKASYWWTKPQLMQIRDEYKNEVMMEGVRNLVKARVEQEENDSQIIEQRVEQIMQLKPGMIANFLQSTPTKAEKQPKNDDIDSDSESRSSESSSSSEGTELDPGSGPRLLALNLRSCNDSCISFLRMPCAWSQ